MYIGGVSLLEGSEAPAWSIGCEKDLGEAMVQVPRSSEVGEGAQDTAAARRTLDGSFRQVEDLHLNNCATKPEQSI